MVYAIASSMGTQALQMGKQVATVAVISIALGKLFPTHLAQQEIEKNTPERQALLFRISQYQTLAAQAEQEIALLKKTLPELDKKIQNAYFTYPLNRQKTLCTNRIASLVEAEKKIKAEIIETQAKLDPLNARAAELTAQIAMAQLKRACATLAIMLTLPTFTAYFFGAAPAIETTLADEALCAEVFRRTQTLVPSLCECPNI
jgi:hypothetical protein